MPHKFHYICFILLLVSCTGCQLVTQILPPAPVTAIPAPTAAPIAPIPAAPQGDPEGERINELLQAARDALAGDRLTTPDDDNAYLRYLQVLALQPDNPKALLGMTDIADKYLQWALEEARRGQYKTANDFVSKAHSVDEGHPGITPVAALIADQRRAHIVDYPLPELSLREPATQDQSAAGDPQERQPGLFAAGGQQLDAIARHIEKTQANIIIYAATDIMGRKIYQYLNQATDERIRAQFEYSSQVVVRLIIL